jgi:hypothetical protein
MTLTSVVSNEVQAHIKKNDRGDSLNFLDTVLLSFTFVDTETGGWCTVVTVGQGYDQSDKASNKALTGANKYGYRQALLIATGDDPEDDSDDPPVKNGAKQNGNGKAQEPPTWGKPEYIAELKAVQAKLEGLRVEDVNPLPDDKTLAGYSLDQLDKALSGREKKLQAAQPTANRS